MARRGVALRSAWQARDRLSIWPGHARDSKQASRSWTTWELRGDTTQSPAASMASPRYLVEMARARRPLRLRAAGGSEAGSPLSAYAPRGSGRSARMLPSPRRVYTRRDATSAIHPRGPPCGQAAPLSELPPAFADPLSSPPLRGVASPSAARRPHPTAPRSPPLALLVLGAS